MLRATGVTIIAEIGSNHNGELDTAYELIDMAAEAGADIVKFQSFLVDDLLAAGDPNYEVLKKLELPRAWYPKLFQRCRERGVHFLSTATNFTTMDWMEELGVVGYKVASCNITHRPLLERLVKIGKPVIVSTGLASKDDILELADFFAASGFSDYSILHCISQYPAPPESMRLGNITALKELLPCPVGLSDHTHGVHIPAAAVALGARIVEKHISLDRSGLGLDHDVAILPDEFRRLCKVIRELEQALVVDFTPNAEGIFSMRRSLHYASALEKGTTLGTEHLKIVRPEDGLLPSRQNGVLGLRLARDVEDGAPVRMEDFNG